MEVSAAVKYAPPRHGRYPTSEALHYDPEKTGGLQAVVAPPYDVIDAEQREELEARSPYNVVSIDLPQGEATPMPQQHSCWRSGARGARSCRTTNPRCGRWRRTTPDPMDARGRGADSSPACAWRIMAPAGSAHTSAPIPGRRRTASG